MIVFLGGTTKGRWREQIIPELQGNNIEYFNPIVDNWDKAAQEKENQIKEAPDTINLFVLTPQMAGFYSIAEVVDCSHKCPERTIFHFSKFGWTKELLKSLDAIKDLVVNNGVKFASSTEEIVQSVIDIQINLEKDL